MKNSKRLRISYNAPAILSFVLICFAVQLLNVLTKGASNRAVFSVYRSSFLDPLAYLRCVCHVFGHANWNHLMGNMMYILILGPMLEEKYGTSNMVFIMLVTALAIKLEDHGPVFYRPTDAPNCPVLYELSDLDMFVAQRKRKAAQSAA